MRPKNNLTFIASVIPALVFSSVTAAQTAVFINEVHYDNSGADTGEAVEVAGPAGTDLTGWNLISYNGANGTVYSTKALSGVSLSCTTALTAWIMATGSSDWKMLRPMSTPLAPCWTAL